MVAVPAPHESSTRTGTMEAALATPVVSPPMVPATCVPWPSLSILPTSDPSLAPSKVAGTN